MAHFHLINGSAGCMPDSNDMCELWAHAFDTAKQRFSDSLCDACYRAMLESLASFSCFSFNDDCEKCRAGADYVEITACWDDCGQPDANVETIAICADCVQWLANGTRPVSDGADRPWKVPPHMDADVTLGATDCAYCADGEETLGPCEPWFSWRPCELCDSPDGGDREHATMRS